MSEIDPAKLQRAREAFASVAYAKFLGLQLGEFGNGEASIYLDQMGRACAITDGT